MPPYAGAKSKGGKARDGKRSQSRNTTPSSVISAPAASGPATTPFLELDTSKLLVNIPSVYSDILEKLESKTTSLDTKQYQDIISQLNSLGDGAEKRSDLCSAAMRTLHEQYAELEAEQKEKERQAEQARKLKVRQEARAAEAAASQKNNGKPKKRKDRGDFDGVEIKREDSTAKSKALSQIDTSTPYDSPSPSKKLRLSPDTSPLSEVANSPEASPGKSAKASPTKTDVSMDDIEENRVIHKTPAMPQQGFFPDPLAQDSVIYHIREVTPGMTDEERKEIYSVTAFPTKDLSDQIAGTPPDKDFSNAKPTNQVAANTFLTYVEPYVRPLTEEDMAFLRERGDRTTPFLNVPRGKRHYLELWAEEDGMNPPKQDADKLPANQGRGSVENMSEALSSTDDISTGPLHARLLSLLKFEHRSSPSENGTTTNGDIDLFANGNDDTMDLDGLSNGQDDGDKPLPVAASVADLTGSKSALLRRLDWPDSDERLKSELRYLNFLGPDDNIDFDAHNDDDISERLRLLQAELRRVMIVNGARKSRLEKIAQERLAFQEYSTIHEDLDTQVQQAYLKRTRTLGKTKKGGPGGGKPRPGQAALVNSIGISRARDIGDNARILMDRRDRWDKCIGPVFQNMSHGVPGKGTTLFDPKLMAQLEKEEREKLDDEGD